MRHLFITWLLLAPLLCIAQVGIGTTTPNSKSVLDLTSTTHGFLVPRMTGLQKSEMQLTTEDMGMMVFQTDIPPTPPHSPIGLYYFDGTEWNAPVPNGSVNGQTLRWDGNKWAGTSNLFNQGTSIGIGTPNPNTQLQIHSMTVPTTRIQLTNTTTGALNNDGLMMGISLGSGHAHILQNENRPLWFGTHGIERMRIDSLGYVGIDQPNPEALLDVHGTVRIGAAGTILNGIIKRTVEVEIPVLSSMGEGVVSVPFQDASETASVYVSPAAPLEGLMIGYARVNAPGNVEVKFMNMGANMEEPVNLVLYISVIQ